MLRTIVITRIIIGQAFAGSTATPRKTSLGNKHCLFVKHLFIIVVVFQRTARNYS